jgi:hypothetical protein
MEQAVISRLVGAEFTQGARRTQVCSGSQGSAGAGNRKQAVKSRRLRRKHDIVKLALASREQQTQAVMSRTTGTNVAQIARRSQVGSGRQGTAGAGRHEQAVNVRYCAGSQTQSSWLWQAGNRRRKQSRAGLQGRCLSRKPDAFKVTLAGRVS